MTEEKLNVKAGDPVVAKAYDGAIPRFNPPIPIKGATEDRSHVPPFRAVFVSKNNGEINLDIRPVNNQGEADRFLRDNPNMVQIGTTLKGEDPERKALEIHSKIVSEHGKLTKEGEAAIKLAAKGGAPNNVMEKLGIKQSGTANDRAPKGSYDKVTPGRYDDGTRYANTSLDPKKALKLINAYRKEHGLNPLQLNARLTAAAKAHSKDLAKFDRISHYGSDGSNPWDRVKRSGYGARLAAENVGTGHASIEAVIQGWKDSPGHNRNLLLRDAKEMGIALVKDPKSEFKTFWTLNLGTRM